MQRVPWQWVGWGVTPAIFPFAYCKVPLRLLQENLDERKPGGEGRPPQLDGAETLPFRPGGTPPWEGGLR